MQKPKGLYRVKVRVREVNGYCRAGHRPGDQVIFDDNEVKGKICFDAPCSFVSKVYARRYGAELPWLEEEDHTAFHPCPDVVVPSSSRSVDCRAIYWKRSHSPRAVDRPSIIGRERPAVATPD